LRLRAFFVVFLSVFACTLQRTMRLLLVLRLRLRLDLGQTEPCGNASQGSAKESAGQHLNGSAPRDSALAHLSGEIIELIQLHDRSLSRSAGAAATARSLPCHL